jgi:hypothetical protein
MAIADQTTAAALARQFADLLVDEPRVERIWYLAEPPHHPGDSLYLFIWLQVSTVADNLKCGIDDVTRRVLGDREDIGLGLSLFMLDALPDRNLDEEVEPEAVEIPLRGR